MGKIAFSLGLCSSGGVSDADEIIIVKWPAFISCLIPLSERFVRCTNISAWPLGSSHLMAQPWDMLKERPTPFECSQLGQQLLVTSDLSWDLNPRLLVSTFQCLTTGPFYFMYSLPSIQLFPWPPRCNPSTFVKETSGICFYYHSMRLNTHTYLTFFVSTSLI